MRRLRLLLLLLPLLLPSPTLRAQQVLLVHDTAACDSILLFGQLYRFAGTNPNASTRFTLFDTLSADTIVQWNLRLNTSTYSFDTAAACDGYEWQGLFFSIPAGGGCLSLDTCLLSTNIAHCPALRNLHLELFASDTTHLYAEACDQYLWDLSGEEYFSSGTHSLLLENQDFCDSILLLHLSIHHAAVTVLEDSICHGDGLQFYHRYLTHGGSYNQNFSCAAPPHCDSIIILLLTELEIPTIEFEHWFDCPSQTHRLLVHTPVDYLAWSQSYPDGQLDGQEHSPLLAVNPPLTNTYTLWADYLPQRTCPNTASITLDHIRPVEASLHLITTALSDDERHLTARDESHNHYGRSWYLNGEYLSSDATLEVDVDPRLDSVLLWLEAYGDFCTDTAVALLPMHHRRTYTPNVFTPDLPTNNRFRLPWTGIVRFELNIYNRGGLLVYHSTDLHAAWDGTHNGHPCPPGTYVYRVEYSDTHQPNTLQFLQGTITLVR